MGAKTQDYFQKGYTKKLVTGSTGTGGTELEIALDSNNVWIHSIKFNWASPAAAHEIDVGTTTAGEEVIKDAHGTVEMDFDLDMELTTTGTLYVNVTNGAAVFECDLFYSSIA
jgi:hypothetical protein